VAHVRFLDPAYTDYLALHLEACGRVTLMLRLLIIVGIAYLVGARWPGLAQKVGAA
jgi:hypothetical protein